jgi:hypothetical protein
MKHFILLTLFVLQPIISFAQALDYDHLALLFSKEEFQGTARFNAMGGAFGALGGDVSASYINPASGAVFNHNEFSGSIQRSTIKTNADYYGTTTYNEFTKLNAPQWGAVFVFENFNQQSPWRKFALGINYSIQQNFNNSYSVNGNNTANYATFINHPDDTNDPQIDYLHSENQSFTNDTRGLNEVYTFSFSAAYENTLYIGASLNTHSIDFSQDAFLHEQNTDGEGNTLFSDFIQYQSQIGSGVSVGLGIIAKPNRNIRLGISYQSPVWYYDVQEETNTNDADGFLGDTRIETNTIATAYQNNPMYNSYNYTLRTPSKTTFSSAFLFNKSGLITMDYSLQNFKNTHLDDNVNSFTNSNRSITSIANNQASTLRIGSEWRVKQWRFRGGYVLQENIFASQPSSFDTQKYSFGLGFQFKNAKVDLSYEKSDDSELYDFYQQYNQINPATLNLQNSQIGLTLTFLL